MSAVIGGLLASSCAATPTPTSGAADDTQILTVFAAASMEPTFTVLADIFEEENPGVDIRFNFAGSQDLQAQIVEGARVDVFVSANRLQMEPVAEAGLVSGEVVVFAQNQLTIVVPPGNPAGVTSFEDLSAPELVLVVCAPAVPCGAATEKVSRILGVALHPASEEQSVTDVLTKVQAGEADAGLVYETDAHSAGDSVLSIEFPAASQAANENVVATLRDGPSPQLGQSWKEFLMTDEAQEVLAQAGFDTVANMP